MYVKLKMLRNISFGNSFHLHETYIKSQVRNKIYIYGIFFSRSYSFSGPGKRTVNPERPHVHLTRLLWQRYGCRIKLSRCRETTGKMLKLKFTRLICRNSAEIRSTSVQVRRCYLLLQLYNVYHLS